MNLSDSKNYPRVLTPLENDWLLYILPDTGPGYRIYREKIASMLVIGEGRFGEGNYVLGYKGDEPDLSYSSLPIFACGQIDFEGARVQVSVHELYDNKIEFSINNIIGETIPGGAREIRRWSYSYWKPGMNSPFKNDNLRMVEIFNSKGEMVLVLSPASRTIWLYEKASGVNWIIPVTNFLNEMLRGNTKIDRTKGVNVDYVFSNLKMFKDDDFRKALVQYNKHWRRVDLSRLESKPFVEKKGLFGKILGK
ncbi:MAG: hypothetical protein ABSF32_10245 [Ignavibacteria bacterium]|jgi:hypothetical protein